MIDPLAFCFHLDSSGTPGGGFVDWLRCLFPPPKREMVGLADAAETGAFCLDSGFGFGLLPKIDNVPGLFDNFGGDFFGDAAVTGLLADDDCEPKKENAGFFAAAGVGTGGGACFCFCSGLPKEKNPDLACVETGTGAALGAGAGLFVFGSAGAKNEKAGEAGFLAGAGAGIDFGAAFFVSWGEKNENSGSGVFLAGAGAGAAGLGAGVENREKAGDAGFLTGTDDGAGVTRFGLSSFLAPKNEAKASVTGSEMSI